MNREGFREAFSRAEMNLRALELMSRYLNFSPCAVQEEELLSLMRDTGLDRDAAYSALMAALCGLNGEEKACDRELEERYFAGAIHCMDDSGCRLDPYYQTVKLPNATEGAWQLGYKRIAPYECFPSDDLLFAASGREIPQAGYFTKEFFAPVVKQHGREWMTVTPSERNTMLPHVEQAFGKVAVFGLGLGYYPFMASRKDTVTELTVVERDAEIIRLFERLILPQFPHREKICVVQSDAFDFAEGMQGYDCAYVDLWHDVSDGAAMYLRMKKIAATKPSVRWMYWIEPSILAFLRSLILDDLAGGRETVIPIHAENSKELWSELSNEHLRQLAAGLPAEWAMP